MKWVLSAPARNDLRLVLSTSGDQFGLDGQRRYRLLLEQAIDDVATDPHRAGVTRVGESGDVLIYHSRHARSRTPPRQRVGRPRHVIVFKVRGDDIEVLRVLHDAMDVPNRLKDL